MRIFVKHKETNLKNRNYESTIHTKRPRAIRKLNDVC